MSSAAQRLADHIRQRQAKEAQDGYVQVKRNRQREDSQDTQAAPPTSTPVPRTRSTGGKTTGASDRPPSNRKFGRFAGPMQNKIYKTLPQPAPKTFDERNRPHPRRMTDAESRKFIAEDQANANAWFESLDGMFREVSK